MDIKRTDFLGQPYAKSDTAIAWIAWQAALSTRADERNSGVDEVAQAKNWLQEARETAKQFIEGNPPGDNKDAFLRLYVCAQEALFILDKLTTQPQASVEECNICEGRGILYGKEICRHCKTTQPQANREVVETIPEVNEYAFAVAFTISPPELARHRLWSILQKYEMGKSEDAMRRGK